MLHYTELGRSAPAQSRSFLIDAGASFHGYASDITRSYAADTSGEIPGTDRCGRRGADADGGKACAQASDYKQLHIDAHVALMGILKDFGVITVSPEAALETGVSAAFFPHGLGHPIGLQVHDVAGFAESDRGGKIARPDGHPYLRMTRVLEPGMVVTIEPGPVLHRHAAGRSEEERPRRQRRLGARGCVPSVRRHPHRGRGDVHRRRCGEFDAAGVRGELNRDNFRLHA